MSEQWKYLVVLLWLSYMLVCGCVVFMRGFLLHKQEYVDKSSCGEGIADSNTCGDETWWCDGGSRCKDTGTRVVLLLVDALRYDFAQWQEAVEDGDDLPYHNKLRVMQEMLSLQPAHARLWRFVADPPTTTAQRLKALTTGSLPTFVDAGANFATAEVGEDNIVDQLVRRGRPVIMMGDDTWTGLYPGRFARQFPYPSFDVRDLDTVDDGVRRHLSEELARPDWTLLIAHLLGVDHCGHRYGPQHPEMTRKLREVDQLVREVVDAMDNLTVLFVIGDHGMTSTGDHGGDSEAEVLAAMFVYSKRPLLSTQFEGELESVSQVDLVPTLATMLGVPIPFSNLGRLVLGALPSSGDKAKDRRLAASAVWSNVQQVSGFLRRHSQRSNQFPEDDVLALEARLASLERSGLGTEKLVQEGWEYLRLAKLMCEQVWVQFDSALMARGLLIFFLTLFLVYFVAGCMPQEHLAQLLELWPVAVIVCVAAGCCGMAWGGLTGACCWSSLASLLLLSAVGWRHRREIAAHHEARRGLADSLVLAISLCVPLSNSYVQEEAAVLSFLLLTLVWLRLWQGRPHLLLLLLVVVLSGTVRLSHACWSGRDGRRKTRPSSLLLAPVALGVMVTVARMWLRSRGNLVGFSPTVVVARYLPSVLVVCTGGYWALHASPRSARTHLVLPWHLQLLPWVAYTLISASLLCLWVWPLCVSCAPRKELVYGQEDAVPRLFQHVKQLMQPREEKAVPVVYGLATAYSAAFLVQGVFACLLAALLLGSVHAQGLVLLVVVQVVMLAALALLRLDAAPSAGQLLEVPWGWVLCQALMAAYFFYGTGHQPYFPHIHWEAAFVGGSGPLLLQGLLVVGNTFCSQILAGLMLPLLLVAPLTVRAAREPAHGPGELLLLQRSDLLFPALFRLCCKYLLLVAARVFGSVLAAAVHCRHLMVWGLFAPRLVFECAALLVTLPSVFLGYLLVVRVTSQLKQLHLN